MSAGGTTQHCTYHAYTTQQQVQQVHQATQRRRKSTVLPVNGSKHHGRHGDDIDDEEECMQQLHALPEWQQHEVLAHVQQVGWVVAVDDTCVCSHVCLQRSNTLFATTNSAHPV